MKRVGIVGSGIMGAGIAEVAAKAGFEVILRSRHQASAEGMVAALEKALARQVERGKLDEAERTAVISRVTSTTVLSDLADCDLVIESVVEDLAVKKHLFSELDHYCRNDAILATNTSTLPVVEMAVETGRPERVCGIHFFNPAPAMGLVEIVRPLLASDETIAAGRGIRRAVRQGRGDRGRSRRLRRERAPLSLPQQRRADARSGHGVAKTSTPR